jgi:hypothetical protein
MIPNVPEHIEAHAVDQAIWKFVRQQSVVPVHINKSYRLDDSGNILIVVKVKTLNPPGVIVFHVAPQIGPVDEGDDSADSWKKA